MLSLVLYLLLIFALVWGCGGYFAFMRAVSVLCRKKRAIDQSYQPKASVIIPTHNEGLSISAKLDNILGQDYPKENLQIIVADSGSSDKTVDLVRAYADKGVELLIQERRSGKGAAVIHALNYAKNGIVIVTDGNSFFDGQVLKPLLRNFSDPEVGGVTGRFFLKDNMKNAEASGSYSFREYENVLRGYESSVDSAVSLYGELFASRKELIVMDPANLTEDFEASISLVKKGFRLVYEPLAGIYEYAPSNVRDVLIQKKRVVIGTIQSLFKHRDMLFNPRYGGYGMVILPGHKLFPALGVWFIIALIFFTAIVWKALAFYLIVIGIVSAAICAGIAVSVSGRSRLVASGKYFLLLNLACFLAWMDYFRGNYGVNWEKMRSSRPEAGA
ncbi:MAG: glycosyltransferase [Candidatus Omnitrophica bacterium]|nr:glycosyltransferase [Candidatus Omnitrophota bacterium]